MRHIIQLSFAVIISATIITSCSPEMMAKMKGYPSRIVEGDSEYNPPNEDSSVPDQKRATTNSNSSSSDGDYESTFGFAFGGGAQWDITENITYQTGLMYARKGAKRTLANTEIKTVLNYIDLPQTIHYNLGNSDFDIFAGLQPSIMISAKNKNSFQGNEEDFDTAENYNTLDLAGVVGIGYTFKETWYVNLGYDYGILNINNQDNFGNTEARNRFVWLGVNYRFNL